MQFDFSLQPGRTCNKICVNGNYRPLISVITAFYNAGKHFDQAFNSVINQTFPFFEWIIVDDGTTDKESLEILMRLSNRDSRIRIYHKQNGGPASARNEAIKHSSTDFILPFDADDLADPTYFECLYFGLYFNPDKDWCYTDSIGFDAQQYTWCVDFDAKRLRKYNFLTYSGLIRKRAITEVGGYDESEKHIFEDWHMWIKLLKNGSYPVRENYYGFWYRRTDSGEYSLILNNKAKNKKAREIIRRETQNFNYKDVVVKDYSHIVELGNFSRGVEIDVKQFDAFYDDSETNKTHILMILPWLEMGGADRFNLTFCKLIDRQKYRISIVLTKPCENPWRQRVAQYVDEIYDLPSFLDMENYPEFISYLIRTRETKIVFLSHSYMGYSLLPWLKINFPKLCLVDYMHIEEKYWRSGGFARTTAAMDAFLDHTYTCNEMTRKILIDEYGKDASGVETVYIGVDKNEFYPYESKREIREKLDLPLDKRIILFPCRMTPQKRPFLMVEIASAIKKTNEDIIFVVVGNGEQFDLVCNTIRRLGLKDSVLMLGEKKNMADYYNACDLTLICSVKEGLALAAYESLACGTPVVSSDVGGQKELIDDTVGKLIPMVEQEEIYDCRTFEESEVNQYVDAIILLLNDPERLKLLGIQGRKRIEEHYEISDTIFKLEKSFKDLTEGKKDNKITDSFSSAQSKAVVEELNLLYSEYAKVEETTRGINKLVSLANSNIGRKITKKIKKLGLYK